MDTQRKKLFVDLGHSEKFQGAIGIVSEVNWNRKIFPYFMEEIDQSYWEVIRVPDEFTADLNARMNLIRRINWVNSRATNKDFLLSIHGNSAARIDARGVTTCYLGGSDFARIEAVKMSKSYSQETGVPIWGTGEFADTRHRDGRIGIIRDTKPFTLLVEAGFVSNPEDMKANPVAAARGIANYYNLYNPNYKKPMAEQILPDQELVKYARLLKEKGIIKSELGLDNPAKKSEVVLMIGRALDVIDQMLINRNAR
jgi:N-acetylmuramoyl-L-alanine amidase